MIHSTDKAICVKRQLLHVMGGGGGSSKLMSFCEPEWTSKCHASGVYVN